MAPPRLPGSDENENVICISPPMNGGIMVVEQNGRMTVEHPVSPPASLHHQSPTSQVYLMNSTTLESITIDEDDDPARLKLAQNGGGLMPPSAAILSCASQYRFKTQFYQKIRSGIWIFPLLVVILVPTVCLTPYIAAVLQGHVRAIFPYVSDTGSLSPQATYFSQLLDIIALLIFATSFYRYKMLKHIIRVKLANSNAFIAKPSERLSKQLERCNFFALLIIDLSAFGVIIIGNFRVTENVFGHFFGVAFAFFGMFLYMCLMVYMSHQISLYKIESKPYTMTVITLSAGISLFGCVFFSLISIYLAGLTDFLSKDFRLMWRKDQAGFTTHIIGTAFEWMAINTVGPFYLCLFSRMKAFKEWGNVRL